MVCAYINLAVGRIQLSTPRFHYTHAAAAAAAAKSLQSCPTLVRTHRQQPTRLPCLWDSPGKNTGVVAISFSSAWKWKVKVKSLSCVQLLATPWTAAYQAPPSVGFSRQEYWSGVPLPSLIDTHTHIQKWLPSAQLVKNLPATKDTRIQFLDQEDPLEKEMAIQSSILAWRIRQRSLTVYSP